MVGPGARSRMRAAEAWQARVAAAPTIPRELELIESADVVPMRGQAPQAMAFDPGRFTEAVFAFDPG